MLKKMMKKVKEKMKNNSNIFTVTEKHEKIYFFNSEFAPGKNKCIRKKIDKKLFVSLILIQTQKSLIIIENN